MAILSSVSENNLEEKLSAFRRIRAITAVAELQKKSVEKGSARISLEEINSEIKAERSKHYKWKLFYILMLLYRVFFLHSAHPEKLSE